MKNIHIVPTDKPSRLYLEYGDGVLSLAKQYLPQTSRSNNQHIYITSDEEITGFENNIWVIKGNRIFLWQNTMALVSNNKPKKIILTTDQDLIADGIQTIDDEFLEWVVKNPSCDEVEIQEVRFFNPKNNWSGHCKWEIVTPKEEPKQETECIVIKNFDEEFVELFNPMNKSLGFINETQLLDIQCQIAEKQLKGYYVMVSNLKCEIDSEGEIQNWDNKTFKTAVDLVYKLRRIQKNISNGKSIKQRRN